MPGKFDTEALAGQTFYRAVAAPSQAGSCPYVGIINPLGSGIRTFVDALYIWPGLPSLSAEVGLIHYATAFNEAPFTEAYSTFLVPNHYGSPNSKTVLWCGDYPANVEPQIDYIFQGPNNAQPSFLEKPPYPYAIIEPSDGVVLWCSTQGYELKAGIWIRELPL